MISASYKLKNVGETPLNEIQKIVAYCQQKHGFVNHRVLEPSPLRKSYILLTYWASSKDFRKAMRN